MRLARARPTDQHHVLRGLDELSLVQFTHQRFIDMGGGEIEARQIPMRRKPRSPHLIRHGAHRSLRRLGLDELLHEDIGRELAVTCLGQQLRIAARHAV